MSEKNINVSFSNISLKQETKDISPSEFHTIANIATSNCRARWIYHPKIVLLAVTSGSERSIACGKMVASALKDLGAIAVVPPSLGEDMCGSAVVVSLDPSSASRMIPGDIGNRNNSNVLDVSPIAIDLIVGVAADETVLQLVRERFPCAVPPIVAFNISSPGLLTLFDFPNFKVVLNDIFFDTKFINLRTRLKCSIKNENGTTQHLVMNEIYFERDPKAGLSHFEVFCDNDHLTTVQGDGLILSTSSSDATYSLSAGGPLVQPEMRSINFTFINSHSLSSRPVVFPADSKFKIVVPSSSRASAWITFDGQARMLMKPGDEVFVSMSKWPAPIYLPGGTTSIWTRQLKDRLGWNMSFIPGNSNINS